MRGTGVHYGVVTCDACKAFYHRNYGKRGMPMCAKNGACDVTGTARSLCQRCRMTKCQDVGMSKLPSIPQNMTAERSPGHAIHLQDIHNNLLEDDILSAHEQKLTSIHYVSRSVIAAIQHQYEKQQVLDRKLTRCVPASCEDPASRGVAQADLSSLLCQVHADIAATDLEKNILRYISYLKAIPGFGKMSTNDKCQLLKYGHFDFFLLEDYPGFNEALNVYCTSSLSCRPIQELNDLWGTEFVNEVVRFTQRLKHLNMTLKEIIFAELICVLATDRCSLSEPDIVNAVQWQMVNILLTHLQATYMHPMRRFAKLMDMVADMRKLSEWYSDITRRLCQTSVSVQKRTLLMEMFNV
ncbi:vitamin D3 receptor-like [Haliotis asinina]|uniref:vitamin D3 receptor-like n=1 Tax=Haliotis asinina TaxID=109174 RepID=UPI003532187D